MHARIATARTRPGSRDRVQETWRGLLARYEESGAFHGMIALYEPDEEVAVTLTLWSSDELATQVATELREAALAAFADVLVEAPSIKKFDVLLADMSP
jgi:quinol monooxygenase YgiN